MTQNEMGGTPTGQSARKYLKFADFICHNDKEALVARCLECARITNNPEVMPEIGTEKRAHVTL